MTVPALVVGLVGRPNCGKTTLFNALTGDHQWVGNWPGVTVEGVTGAFERHGRRIEVVDLPGAYTLTGTRALDEEVTAEFLSAGRCDVIVNVVDAAAPERSLYLTAQVLESQGRLAGESGQGGGVPMIVALNRMDKAEADGVAIEIASLAEALGCPVVPLSAARGDGVERLADAVLTAAQAEPPAFPPYGDLVIGLAGGAIGAHGRWRAIRALEDSADEARHADALALAAARHAFAAHAVRQAVHRDIAHRRSFSDRLDGVLLHPWWGVGAFLVAMYVMFLWTIHLGGAFIDAFDGIAGAMVETGLVRLLDAAGLPHWLVLVAEGAGKGVRTIASFVPLVLFLYLFLALLEETGYMARAAVVMDRFMRRIGLPGKAFVPLVVGLGCNVPAVMAARTLEEEADRKATIAMTPFISCGARLPVYALFAATFFPASGQNLVFALYLIGIAVAVFTGFVLKRALFAAEAPPLLLELPAYHRPSIGSVMRRAWDRVLAFVTDAGKVVVPVVMLLTIANAVTLDGRVVRAGSEPATILAEAGRLATPLLAPIGIAADNWPATVGLFTGLFAKEAVVGTLGALYAQGGGADQGAERPIATLVADALATIPANLATLVASVADPLGIAQAESAATLDPAAAGAFAAAFDGTAGAFAYLVFVLLYAPCVATIAAMRREAGAAWTLFVMGWATTMGYACATIAYQGAVFTRAPLVSAAWMAGAVALVALAVLVMRRHGRRLAPLVGGGGCNGCRGCRG